MLKPRQERTARTQRRSWRKHHARGNHIQILQIFTLRHANVLFDHDHARRESMQPKPDAISLKLELAFTDEGDVL